MRNELGCAAHVGTASRAQLQVYSIPNTVLPFFGGVISDKLGKYLVGAPHGEVLSLHQICVTFIELQAFALCLSCSLP